MKIIKISAIVLIILLVGLLLCFNKYKNSDMLGLENKVEVDNKTDEGLLRTYLDLNNDGFKEMIVSNKQDDGKAGLFWQIYVNKGNGTYSNSDDLIITFNPGAVGYSKFPGDAFESLLTYSPSNANEGGLVSYRIQDNQIIEKHITIEPTGKDRELYNQLIQNPFQDKNSKVKIEEIPAR